LVSEFDSGKRRCPKFSTPVENVVEKPANPLI